MAADSVVPLASASALTEGAFADLVRSYSNQAVNDIMIEATRACETECARRLAPFTITESHRAEGVDPDEMTDSANLPMDLQGSLGRSYAAALSTSTLIRHVWLNEYAPVFQEMWSSTINSVSVIRSYGGGQTVSNSQILATENDTGHMWFQLGLFLPFGSWVRVNYSGGYTTVPADLRRACVYMAAAIVCRELDPMQSSGHNATDLEALSVAWLSSYVRS